MSELIKDLQNFLDYSLSPFHVVDWVKKELESQGFVQANLDNLREANKVFFTRSYGSLLALKLSEKNRWAKTHFSVIGAHSDSPGLKLKSLPEFKKENYLLVETEVYGSPLLYTWFDRDLLVAGLIFLADGTSSLYKSPYPVAKIPSLAIHLQREVNEVGLRVNPHSDLLPILAMESDSLSQAIQQHFHALPEKIISFELYLADSQKSSLWGLNQEFLSSARLDNLAMCHAALKAFLACEPKEDQLMGYVIFDHEEIGSETEAGAASDFLVRSLEEFVFAHGGTRWDFLQVLNQSFFLSADMAHGVHPNYVDKHDRNHRPIMNQGPVFKLNHKRRYATSGEALAKLVQLAKKADIPFQYYHHRSDLPCGTTIGPIVASKLGVLTADVGNPMLGMHSIRETAGTKDHEMIVQLFQYFYDEPFF